MDILDYHFTEIVIIAAIINVIYRTIYEIKQERPARVSNNKAFIRWWNKHQIVFMLMSIFNLMVFCLSFISCFRLQPIAFVAVLVFLPVMLFTESPYQKLLKRTCIQQLLSDSPSLSKLIERGLYVGIINRDSEIGGIWEYSADVGFLEFSKDVINYHEMADGGRTYDLTI